MVMFHKIHVNASNNDIRRGGGGADIIARQWEGNRLLINVRQHFFECIF
jgi:hypothetical protein